MTAVEGVEVGWANVAELFTLDPAVAYLNHGGFGVVPVPVQRAQQRIRAEMDANPMAFFARGVVDRLRHTRQHLARFLNADPEDTALVPNVTAATQIVLNAIAPQPGEEVVVTDHGYGATRMAVEWLCARTGATPKVVSVDLAANDDEIVATLVASVRPGRTRLVIVDQITSPTAKLLPVARIVAALRELDVPVFVDGAHVPGMLPVDVRAIGADFWSGNLHKWAFAPRPTAVLVVAPARRRRVEPLVVSWEYASGYPGAVEFGGTLDYTAWLAAPTGLYVLNTLGADLVRKSNVELVTYGQRVVAEALDVDPATLPGQDSPVAMRLVPLPPSFSEPVAAEVHRRLAADFRCEVALTRWGGRLGLRVCAQIYNSRHDYDRVAMALTALLPR